MIIPLVVHNNADGTGWSPSHPTELADLLDLDPSTREALGPTSHGCDSCSTTLRPRPRCSARTRSHSRDQGPFDPATHRTEKQPVGTQYAGLAGRPLRSGYRPGFTRRGRGVGGAAPPTLGLHSARRARLSSGSFADAGRFIFSRDLLPWHRFVSFQPNPYGLYGWQILNQME